MTDSDVVIRVEGLGKKYALHHEKSERYTALRDVVARQARAAGRLMNPFTLGGQLRKAQREAAEASEEEFWALKDVRFEIRRGGRAASLLEVGTGFHPELR
jgi:lipopolysaccharide transport system ATP-binding protein